VASVLPKYSTGRKPYRWDCFSFILTFAGELTPLDITMALRLALCGSACSEQKSDFANLADRMTLIWLAAGWLPTICLNKAPVVDARRVAAMQLQMGEKRGLILRTQRTK
jgi:hypothetical protein